MPINDITPSETPSAESWNEAVNHVCDLVTERSPETADRMNLFVNLAGYAAEHPADRAAIAGPAGVERDDAIARAVRHRYADTSREEWLRDLVAELSPGAAFLLAAADGPAVEGRRVRGVSGVGYARGPRGSDSEDAPVHVELFLNETPGSMFIHYRPDDVLRPAYRGELDLEGEDQIVLDQVFELFNREVRPGGYTDRSLSVADVVTLEQERSYAVAGVGFRPVDLVTGGALEPPRTPSLQGVDAAEIEARVAEGFRALSRELGGTPER